MSPSLRFVHLSDTHLGYRQYGLNERLDDWNRATREVIDYAIQNEVDCVVHSGDLFNSNRVDHTSLIHAIESLRVLRDAEIPFFVIDGNHDRRKGSQAHTALDVLQSLNLCSYLRPERGSLVNATAQINGTNIIGLGYNGAYLKPRLIELSQQMPGGRNVVVLHAGLAQHIEGGQPEITLSELEVLRPSTAYLALGHSHNKFSVDNWIFNPGSPEHYRFSDSNTDRCFYDVTLRGGVPKVTEIAMRGTRRMESIEVEYAGDDYAVLGVVQSELDDAEKGQSLADSLLRIILKGEASKPPNTGELKQFVEERYEPFFCTVLDNTLTSEDVLIDAPGTLDDLEKKMFESSFSRYDEQTSEVATFARAVLREVVDAQLSNTDDAESIAQHISRFRREHL
ncbi:MAG: DNA repair exonuclease [Euryarchaeota archaeon]|nr:DNA repair exonuclease [Euryarchaeota archaeon]